MHGFARRRVGRQEAEDVVRDAYLHFVQRGTAATLEQPRAYLIRTAANLAGDFARKAKIRPAISQPSAHSNSRNVMVTPPPLKRSLRAYPGASALHGGWRDHAGAHVIINRESALRGFCAARRAPPWRSGAPRCAAARESNRFPT